MGIILWIVIGLVVSLLTLSIERYVIRRHIIITLLIGVAGAILGGELTAYLGFNEVEGMRFMMIIWATLGAAFLLTWYRAFEKFYS